MPGATFRELYNGGAKVLSACRPDELAGTYMAVRACLNACGGVRVEGGRRQVCLCARERVCVCVCCMRTWM